jgi:hypothetical protein
VSKDSDQTEAAPRKFKLGPLGSLNQVTKGLAKTIRAMADGTLDSQVGARICNGLGLGRVYDKDVQECIVTGGGSRSWKSRRQNSAPCNYISARAPKEPSANTFANKSDDTR